MVSISDMLTIKYQHNLGTFMDTEKYNIPKQCRICDTCFTLLATIRGNLFTRHPNNSNHVYKDVNYLLSVIIVLRTDVRGDESVLLNGITTNDTGKRAHVLKHPHGRCVVGAFDKILQ